MIHSSQIPGQSTPLMRPILHFLMLIPVGVPRSIDLLRGQSSFAYFPPANRPVKKSKFVPALARPQQNLQAKTHRKRRRQTPGSKVRCMMRKDRGKKTASPGERDV